MAARLKCLRADLRRELEKIDSEIRRYETRGNDQVVACLKERKDALVRMFQPASGERNPRPVPDGLDDVMDHEFLDDEFMDDNVVDNEEERTENEPNGPSASSAFNTAEASTPVD